MCKSRETIPLSEVLSYFGVLYGALCALYAQNIELVCSVSSNLLKINYLSKIIFKKLAKLNLW
jgi:hypothetical protein